MKNETTVGENKFLRGICAFGPSFRGAIAAISTLQ